jgi:hypothetical protein
VILEEGKKNAKFLFLRQLNKYRIEGKTIGKSALCMSRCSN